MNKDRSTGISQCHCKWAGRKLINWCAAHAQCHAAARHKLLTSVQSCHVTDKTLVIRFDIAYAQMYICCISACIPYQSLWSWHWQPFLTYRDKLRPKYIISKNIWILSAACSTNAKAMTMKKKNNWILNEHPIKQAESQKKLKSFFP